MVGEPGALGGGQTQFYSSSDGSFTTRVREDGGVSTQFQSPTHWWYVDLAAADGVPLTPGVYLDARRIPFLYPGHPGLDVYGDGAGCNQVTGSFVVKQLAFAQDGSVEHLWATFEHHCEGAEPALYGDLRVNAEIVVTVSAPSRLTAPFEQELSVDVTASDVGGAALTLSAVNAPAGSSFEDHGDGTGTLRWTPTRDDIGPHTVTFHAENGQGASDETRTTIRVTGETWVRMRSDPGDQIGLGASYEYDPSNASFVGFANGDLSAQLNVHQPSGYYRAAFALDAADAAPLLPGIYRGAVGDPIAQPGRPFFRSGVFTGSCQGTTAEFQVKQFEHVGDELVSLWAVFEEHCGEARPALRGEIRYNADVRVWVKAPLRARATVRRPFAMEVTGANQLPPGDVALTAEGLPPGSSFSDHGNGSATLTWTPARGDVGVHRITFRARSAAGDEDWTETLLEVSGEQALVLHQEKNYYTEHPEDHRYGAESEFRTRDGFSGETVLDVYEPGGTYYSRRLHVGPGADGPLAPGWYPAIYRPDAVEPGGAGFLAEMEVYCYEHEGFLRVKQARANAEGVLESAWLVFTQVCGELGTATRGELRFNVDAPLLVNAPPGATTGDHETLEFAVDATADAPYTLRAEGLPPGANFELDPGGASGRFRWSPLPEHAGVHEIHFIADQDGGVADTAWTYVRVNHVNRVPIADAGGPYEGYAGVPITLDGTGSSDPDGDSLTYAWEISGLGRYVGATPEVVFPAAGTWDITLYVGDGSEKYDAAKTTATILGAVQARSYIEGGDRTIRLNSGKPAWCVRIEAAENEFAPSDVDLGSLRLTYSGSSGSPVLLATSARAVRDGDRNGVDEIEACFAKEDLRLLFASLAGFGRVNVPVEVSGALTSGQTFLAVVLVDVETGSTRLLARPVFGTDGAPSLEIETASEAPLRANLYDLHGRLVRRFAIEGAGDAGVRRFALEGARGTGGVGLSPGVYFYRVEQDAERVTGRLVITR
jgi:hypothetical protein